MAVEVVLQDTSIIGGGFGGKGYCLDSDLSKPGLNHAERKIFVMGVKETKRNKELQQGEDLLGRFKHNMDLFGYVVHYSQISLREGKNSLRSSRLAQKKY